MFQKLIHFIKYHNAFPIALSVILLSSGAVFAASPQAREVILSEETTVRSVDNSYIVSVNLDTHNPQLQITSIEEDDSFFYVSYSYDTISIDDYVWKGFRTSESLTVSKAALGNRDLGLYVAEEISEVITSEDEYLNKVQTIEKNVGITKKVATTEYSGLIGKMLSPDVEEFEGYVPVIPEEKPVVASVTESQASAQIATANEISAQVAAAVPTKEEITLIIQQTVRELLAEGTTAPTTVVTSTSTPTSGDTNTDTESPVITIVGNNPAEIARNASYVDLGATVTDNINDNLGIAYALDGVTVTSFNLDTSTDVTYTLTYSTTDQAGNTGTAERTVIVGTGITTTTEEATATTTPEAVVTDTTAPVITIVGNSTENIDLDETYTDSGATATDDTDGDITEQITTINGVDTTTAGTYTVTYNVTDQAGNSALQVTREVTVITPEVVIPPEDTTASTTPETATSTSEQ